jgi:hypothetical protein
MTEHDAPRDVLTEMPPDLERRLRSAGLAVRERSASGAPVTTASARGYARRRRFGAGTAAVVLAVLVGWAGIALGSRGASTTVHTGSTGGTGTTLTTTAPAAARTAIDWETSTVSLKADQVKVVAAGRDFTPPAAANQIDVHSDPGTPAPAGYTTIELTWQQHGVEMRINIYFAADAQRWWANEIRVYNGKSGTAADWIGFDGRWFDSPLGQSYRGDLHLGRDGAALDITGLDLQAFVRPKACSGHQTPDALESLYPTIEMGLPPGGFGASVRLYDETCALVTDLRAVSFTWSADDPTIVAVAPDTGMTTTATLTGRRVGSTVVRVVARDTRTGAVLASTSMTVTVRGQGGS